MPETNDQEPTTSGKVFADTTKPSSRRAYSNVRRELTEDEMLNPAVHRLIVSDIDQCEVRIEELERFRHQFYDAHTERAVLKERLEKKSSLEILHDVALGVGFFFGGLAPSVWDKQPYGWLSVVGGAILIVCSVIARKHWR